MTAELPSPVLAPVTMTVSSDFESSECIIWIDWICLSLAGTAGLVVGALRTDGRRREEDLASKDYLRIKPSFAFRIWAFAFSSRRMYHKQTSKQTRTCTHRARPQQSSAASVKGWRADLAPSSTPNPEYFVPARISGTTPGTTPPRGTTFPPKSKTPAERSILKRAQPCGNQPDWAARVDPSQPTRSPVNHLILHLTPRCPTVTVHTPLPSPPLPFPLKVRTGSRVPSPKSQVPSPKSQVSLLLRIPSPTYYAPITYPPSDPNSTYRGPALVPGLSVRSPPVLASPSQLLLRTLWHITTQSPAALRYSLPLQRPQNVAKPSSLPVTTFIRLRRRYLTLYSSLSLSYTHPHKLSLRKPIRDSE
ncbi:hypothetical protein CCUS01_11653 [Colletotrichum cuscutae]|uniref:Uncharacterized protein n=1 Tax=Colletotrichum cuscutae TaxID=1209917 RepID=A0AAI9XHI0_9PEZI|nr:hypothetical protein CCUS01_11653 [Colletotrichum cuscutae]